MVEVNKNQKKILKHDSLLTIAVGRSRKEMNWKNKEMLWSELVEKLSKTTRTIETYDEYKKMSKSKKDEVKDVGGFVGGSLKSGRRKADNVGWRQIVTLDADFVKGELWAGVEMLFGYGCLMYSTHSHTPSNPRLRLVIPLKRPVSPDEYGAVSRRIADDLGIDFFDDTTYEPHRLMYWPSTSSDGEYLFKLLDEEWIDPDEVLERYDDWTDLSYWPESSRTKAKRKKEADKQGNPREKNGIVGAFCRTYDVMDVIEKYLNDIYTPCSDPNRYTYSEGGSAGGLVIYGDGDFTYSHHGTDPISGKLCNAFDLVRLHKFGDLNDKASFKAISELAVEDENVRLNIANEKRLEAEDDFSEEEWLKKLEYEPRSTVLKNTLKNLTLILENDPKLKGLVFNQQLDGIEIKGEMPWEHPSKYWRDADDAQLITYIDFHYGTFSSRNFQIAVAKVTDDRSYHPIREFLDNLPEWDKEKRVDKLLIDYLGADDNVYVQAVTRKTLCAAISRVLNPGCKFDSMLVLNGPQGVGKSTLISRLAGEWFSDSLNLGDTKDKTAAEKLQGYWILEIGELAGLRKAEIETLRSFISRQNDIYRAAFGKRATPHLRQCIFFGTTNAESGYLRDTTGNRRFRPVKTPGNGIKKSWDLKFEEIQQIWAEALVYVKQGEKLYLDPSMEVLAKTEQREAMESDEREGLVKDFLEVLLPEDWDDMDLYERRNFLNGSEFGGSSRVGVTKRTMVSNMEIWCECFGKERANIKRSDSNELSSILIKLCWVKSTNKTRIPLYGPQWIFVPVSSSKT